MLCFANSSAIDFDNPICPDLARSIMNKSLLTNMIPVIEEITSLFHRRFFLSNERKDLIVINKLLNFVFYNLFPIGHACLQTYAGIIPA